MKTKKNMAFSLSLTFLSFFTLAAYGQAEVIDFKSASERLRTKVESSDVNIQNIEKTFSFLLKSPEDAVWSLKYFNELMNVDFKNGKRMGKDLAMVASIGSRLVEVLDSATEQNHFASRAGILHLMAVTQKFTGYYLISFFRPFEENPKNPKTGAFLTYELEKIEAKAITRWIESKPKYEDLIEFFSTGRDYSINWPLEGIRNLKIDLPPMEHHRQFFDALMSYGMNQNIKDMIFTLKILPGADVRKVPTHYFIPLIKGITSTQEAFDLMKVASFEVGILILENLLKDKDLVSSLSAEELYSAFHSLYHWITPQYREEIEMWKTWWQWIGSSYLPIMISKNPSSRTLESFKRMTDIDGFLYRMKPNFLIQRPNTLSNIESRSCTEALSDVGG